MTTTALLLLLLLLLLAFVVVLGMTTATGVTNDVAAPTADAATPVPLPSQSQSRGAAVVQATCWVATLPHPTANVGATSASSFAVCMLPWPCSS